MTSCHFALTMYIAESEIWWTIWTPPERYLSSFVVGDMAKIWSWTNKPGLLGNLTFSFDYSYNIYIYIYCIILPYRPLLLGWRPSLVGGHRCSKKEWVQIRNFMELVNEILLVLCCTIPSAAKSRLIRRSMRHTFGDHCARIMLLPG